MYLREAFGIHPKEVVALVGGGGKTTLMFALAKELKTAGFNVVTTTTTRIEEPSSSQTPAVVLVPDNDKVSELVRSNLDRYSHITVVKERLVSSKLAGLAPDKIAALMSIKQVDYIIVEADGAAQHPLKAPGDYEPVIPATASLVVPVVGIDALGETLSRVVFRPEIAARLLGVSLEATVTPEIVAELVTAKSGIAKGSPVGVRIIPLVNKVDIAGGIEKGRLVARAILEKNCPEIEKVVLGQVGRGEAVVEVIQQS